MDDTTAVNAHRQNVDVLALTDQEQWDELIRFMYFDAGRFHLSGLKALAEIGSRDTHITLDQVKALHRALGCIVEGLDRPASEGPSMGRFVGLVSCNVADLAADAGVDADALKRHFDGQGPLSQFAFLRVFAAMVGTKAPTAIERTFKLSQPTTSRAGELPWAWRCGWRSSLPPP